MARITNQGKALIAQKQAAGQPVVIDRFIWAHISGLDHTQPVNPDEPMPSAGQIKSDAAPTQAGYVNPDLVVYSSVLGSNVGTWSFNWLGLASGDTLVAANYVPEQDKDATTGDDIGNNLTKNFALQYKDAQDTSGVTISADTWMIDWTARLDGIDDRERKANQDIYGRQTFINDGFKVERNGGYTLKAGWGYVAGIRINQAADADLGDPGALPKDIWLDVALEGDISGVVATVTPTFSNTTMTDYTDSAGRVHYLEKIAAINGAGVVTDQRTSVTVADGETLADLFMKTMEDAPTDENVWGRYKGKWVKVWETGDVKMFSGTREDIEEGWTLMNGEGQLSDGRQVPNISDRFVVASGSEYSADSKGGQKTQTTSKSGGHTPVITINNTTLSLSQIPKHRFRQGSTHIKSWVRFGYETYTGLNGAGQGGGGQCTPYTDYQGDSAAHGHTATADAVDSHEHTVDTTSPYYALAFIIKL